MFKRIVFSSRPFQAIVMPVWQLIDWWRGGYRENTPQFVKKKVLRKYSVTDGIWIETGTYLGTTTRFLLKLASKVYTIEPEARLADAAAYKFRNTKIEVLKGESEKILPDLLPELNGNISFWLDGHYSAGITYKGDQEFPVKMELKCIEENLHKFEAISILIDDVHCFLPESVGYDDRPSLDFIIDWARKHNFSWRIEHDILVMCNWRLD